MSRCVVYRARARLCAARGLMTLRGAIFGLAQRTVLVSFASTAGPCSPFCCPQHCCAILVQRQLQAQAGADRGGRLRVDGRALLLKPAAGAGVSGSF